MVRVAEYWYKEPYDKELWQVLTPTGPMTVDSTTDEAAGVQEKIKAGATIGALVNVDDVFKAAFSYQNRAVERK